MRYTDEKYLYRNRPLTTAEILEEIEKIEAEEDVPDDIFISPPEDKGNETDCDSGDEDCNDPDQLNRNQLQAEAEVGFHNEEKQEMNELYEETPEPPTKKNKKEKRTPRNWSEDVGEQYTHIRASSQYNPVLSLTAESHPLEFFKLFLGEDIVEFLVRETEKYALGKNHNISVSLKEFYVFLGILILSGYVPLPRRRMFWENDEDTHNILVTKSMRRNKFEEIFRFFHAADNNNLPKNDKLAKVRPLIEKLNSKFLRFAPIENQISIDESMIPYFGRHGCKQFIRGKPIRFGYKAWVMALANGYCLNFDIYQGKNSQSDFEESYGLGERVVLNFADILKRNFEDIEFSLFFDNFFTSPRLLALLGDNSFGGTGTVRENRSEKCPLENKKIMNPKARGYYCSAVDESDNIFAVRWKDNSIVTIMSNEFSAFPLQKAKRYSVKERQKVDIDQPYLVSQYNKFMGGVDVLDKRVANYRISIRGKKWFFSILLWMLDVCVVNSTILAHQFGCKMDSLEFRRQIARTLLYEYGTPKINTGPRSLSIIPVASSSQQHLIITGAQRRRCRICQNKTTKACDRCEVPLHDKCFKEYHLNILSNFIL